MDKPKIFSSETAFEEFFGVFNKGKVGIMRGIVKELEMVIGEIIDSSGCQYCRSYEAARILAKELSELGLSVEVVDGTVIYDGPALKKHLGSQSNLLQECTHISDSGNKLSVVHSWCELAKGSGATIFIDYHPSKHSSSREMLKGLLLVTEGQGKHRYRPAQFSCPQENPFLIMIRRILAYFWPSRGRINEFPSINKP